MAKANHNNRRPPLDGVRITDFTWFWAGPHATLLLAFLGAEVIKVESIYRLDPMRLSAADQGVRGRMSTRDPTTLPPEELEKSVMWHDENLNKLSVRLNLRNPRAVELARELVKISDAVIENYSPGVMERMGLGYQSLKQLKPDLVMLSTSACGQTGPHRHYVGFATIFSATSGAAHLTGYPDLGPTDLRDGSDLRVATAGAYALMAALYHHRRTGEGQHIDLSSQECLTALFGDLLMDYSMNSRARIRNANRNDIMAPHNCYPCQGSDRWISIAVGSEDEWKAFCKALGKPQWLTDPSFCDAYQRWKHQDELDRLITEWTSSRTNTEVMHLLQKAGVAAAPSMSSQEIVGDPHLHAWEAFKEIEHPVMGKRLVVDAPWKFSSTPVGITRRAPLLGEHNERVFGELLGLPSAEIARLQQEGVMQ